MPAESYHRIVASRRGGPEVLEVRTDRIPDPAAGDVRVHVQAAGISGLDVMVRSRRFPGFPKPPFTPGVDVVGVVDAAGEGVTEPMIGKRAAVLLGYSGGYAEYVCAPAQDAVPVPEELDAAEAVCLVANYTTAHVAMHTVARVTDGQRVLVQGGAGGVGTALLQLGALAGLTQYATASPHNHELVATLGATPIDYHSEDVVARIRERSGDGVDVVFDPIGGARQLIRSYETLRTGGTLVWFGVAASKRYGASVIPASLVARGLLGLIPDGKKAMTTPDFLKDNQLYRTTLSEVIALLAAGKLSPVIAARFPLLDAARAHQFLDEGRYAGKVVLVNDW